MGKSAVKGFFYLILIAATGALAAITLLAAFSGSYMPEESKVMSLLGLAVPILLIVNLVVGLCWAFARKVWVCIPLVAILGNWNYLSSVIQFHSQQELPPEVTAFRTDPKGYLTIATYNVHNFGNEVTGYSCKEIARLMKDERVDVLCFQESGSNRYFPADSVCKAFAHWPYVFVPGDSIRGVLSMAIFSRYPLINQNYITYDESANSSMMCDVVLGADTVRLLNNHLQTTSVTQNRRKWERELATDNTRREVNAVKSAAGTLHENFLKRAGQTDNICQLATHSPYPVLVCGDFNSLPSSYTYHRLNDILKDGFRSAGSGYMYTYRYGKRLLRIDYIFHSPSLEGVRYTSPDWDLCSDHNPVIFSMKL
ncbi:MAG: endonuclease/exonuclease/phosphatase family protein [Bacteroides sp.]|nr:endonuclease/exonuclease/phosphatase family protein [Bacteroides sp.]